MISQLTPLIPHLLWQMSGTQVFGDLKCSQASGVSASLLTLETVPTQDANSAESRQCKQRRHKPEMFKQLEQSSRQNDHYPTAQTQAET